jgi:hypothetical protein
MLQTISDDQGHRTDYTFNYRGQMILADSNQVWDAGGTFSSFGNFTYDGVG